jgi:hypothetical protein
VIEAPPRRESPWKGEERSDLLLHGGSCREEARQDVGGDVGKEEQSIPIFLLMVLSCRSVVVRWWAPPRRFDRPTLETDVNGRPEIVGIEERETNVKRSGNRKG